MKRFLLLSVAAMPVLFPMAVAQEADDQPLVADTVIVTAPGQARDAAELIGSASAVNREDLVDQLGGSLGDTLDHLPGVSSTHFGAAASRPVLRGLGAERVQVLTNGVGVLDASAASPDHQVAADGVDADKIEVLRGPAALAYGGQAIGGVVNVIDGLIAESSLEEPLEVDAYSAHNSVNDGLEGAARMKAQAGNWVFALSASARDFGVYEIPGAAESEAYHALEHEHEEEEHDEEEEHEEEEEAYGVLPSSQLQTQTLAGGVSYIGEKGFFGVAVRRQTSDYGIPGHAHHHEEEDHEGDEEEEHEDEHEHEASPFIDYEQTRIDLRGALDLDAGPLTRISGALAFGDYTHSEIEGDEGGTRYDTEGYEGRVELDHTVVGLDGAVGVQWLDKEFDASGDEQFITETDTQSLGVFLYEARDWENGYGVEGGLRGETVDYDNVQFGAADFSMFSASLGGHKHWDSGVFLGAQISLAERAPNETELFASGVHTAAQRYEEGDPSLDVETGLNLETALRYTSNRFSIGTNIFFTDFSDFIYAEPGVTLLEGVEVDEVEEFPVYLYTQQDAEFFGGEIYGEARLGSALGADWTLDGSLDIVEAEFDDGAYVPLIPPLTLSAGAQAEWRWFNAGVEATYAAEQEDVGDGGAPTDAYTRIDLRAGLGLGLVNPAMDGAEAFIELRNATDEEIRYSTSVINGLAPAEGRNLRLGLKLSL